MKPLIHISILNWCNYEDTINCVRSIEQLAYKHTHLTSPDVDVTVKIIFNITQNFVSHTLNAHTSLLTSHYFNNSLTDGGGGLPFDEVEGHHSGLLLVHSAQTSLQTDFFVPLFGSFPLFWVEGRSGDPLIGENINIIASLLLMFFADHPEWTLTSLPICRVAIE